MNNSKQEYLEYLFGKLLAIIIVVEAEEKNCRYRDTSWWKNYESFRNNRCTFPPEKILFQAERIIFQDSNQEIENLIKQIAIAADNITLPSDFYSAKFALGLWRNLPDEREYVEEDEEEDIYEEEDEDEEYIYEEEYYTPMSKKEYYGYEPYEENDIDKADRLCGIPDPRLVED